MSSSVDSFVQFISQDTHYLQDYVRTLLTLAAKSPDFEATKMLTTHAAAAATAETGLHAELMTDLGRDPAELLAFDVRPTTRAYTSFLLATVFSGSFADGLAAVIPCFWIYAEVGQHLQAGRLAQPGVPAVDRLLRQRRLPARGAPRAGPDRPGRPRASAPRPRRRRGSTSATAARYEWMFWDAAYRQEAWPV